MTAPVDTLLHSEAPIALIEAAAGCGKTWTAAKFAKEMSARLDQQRVLLLSHTHAACGEFLRRCVGGGLRVDVETCDSFALKVVGPYATALGLPYPLDTVIGRPGGVSFAELGAKAVELLQRAPTIARLISDQYPVIILDEHQDASTAQHGLVMALMQTGGSKLRIFGDPMQALHHGDAEQYVNWDTLWADCRDRVELTEPHRWGETPKLGEWITAARATLRAGRPVSTDDAPPSVHLIRTHELAGRNRLKDPTRAANLLHDFLKPSKGRAVIIAHLSEMVRTLAQSAGWRASINEGAVLEHLNELLDQAENPVTHAGDLARAFIGFVDEVGSGFAKSMRENLAERAGTALRLKRAGSAQRPWLDILSSIYAEPTHRGLASAMSSLMLSLPAGYVIRLKDHASTLRALASTDDPRGHLQALSRLRRKRAQPAQSVSTLHKAKGLEFRRVLVCPADQHQYPPDAYGARLFYVAMSRATHELTIVIDGSSPLAHLDIPVAGVG